MTHQSDLAPLPAAQMVRVEIELAADLLEEIDRWLEQRNRARHDLMSRSDLLAVLAKTHLEVTDAARAHRAIRG